VGITLRVQKKEALGLEGRTPGCETMRRAYRPLQQLPEFRCLDWSRFRDERLERLGLATFASAEARNKGRIRTMESAQKSMKDGRLDRSSEPSAVSPAHGPNPLTAVAGWSNLATCSCHPLSQPGRRL
jgi:hypothetical protein